MKRNLLFLTALCLLVLSTEAKKKKTAANLAPTTVFQNGVDSMSYALGINIGTDLGNNLKKIPGGKSNIDLFLKAFSASLKGDSTLMTQEVANEYFKNYMMKAQAQETDTKKAAGEKFLAENKTKPGINTTASGLQYQVLVPTEGAKPKAVDSVTVHYQGFLLDGTKFDSSVDRGEPVTFPLNQVIPGWTEGVQLMSVGSKYKFFIPYTLGYGERGAGQTIPGYSTLVFEVELLGIKTAVEPTAPKSADSPKSAKKATTVKTAQKKK